MFTTIHVWETVKTFLMRLKDRNKHAQRCKTVLSERRLEYKLNKMSTGHSSNH